MEGNGQKLIEHQKNPASMSKLKSSNCRPIGLNSAEPGEHILIKPPCLISGDSWDSFPTKQKQQLLTLTFVLCTHSKFVTPSRKF